MLVSKVKYQRLDAESGERHNNGSAWYLQGEGREVPTSVEKPL